MSSGPVLRGHTIAITDDCAEILTLPTQATDAEPAPVALCVGAAFQLGEPDGDALQRVKSVPAPTATRGGLPAVGQP
ncbi:hypothetical protein E2F48_03860 [Arthrobacter crusticola]|uniref:Uncharacterized protein n=1 Tax=Arthrobacter crusticola TaxID=2547960 RepID=A0A4R5U3G6_9MICC|nr:hypothetical protein [Arthrobacter crusticola]TDK28225.1 hypothetical protein E2F48_03860 [Arthrobacter crusticola]